MKNIDKMKNKKNSCPECGSEEFVTEPNQYDILVFSGNSFEVQSTEQCDGVAIFCRECGKEIDEQESINQKQMVYK